jgi:hypothetical protein
VATETSRLRFRAYARQGRSSGHACTSKSALLDIKTDTLFDETILILLLLGGDRNQPRGSQTCGDDSRRNSYQGEYILSGAAQSFTKLSGTGAGISIGKVASIGLTNFLNGSTPQLPPMRAWESEFRIVASKIGIGVTRFLSGLRSLCVPEIT